MTRLGDRIERSPGTGPQQPEITSRGQGVQLMAAAREYDTVRITAAAASTVDGRAIPPGMQGTVLDARADGTCLVELAFTPQTADADGDFAQAVLCDGQYEIIHAAADLFPQQYYWIRHPDGPFTTLIRISTTYLHPEADDLESLQDLAKRDDRSEMRAFKAELAEAITHPDQFPQDELSNHVQYDDGSPEAFLRRLWRDLYGDEPVTAPGHA
jgi:hypothetical protein